jgi:hypothetical protein
MVKNMLTLVRLTICFNTRPYGGVTDHGYHFRLILNSPCFARLLNRTNLLTPEMCIYVNTQYPSFKNVYNKYSVVSKKPLRDKNLQDTS